MSGGCSAGSDRPGRDDGTDGTRKRKDIDEDWQCIEGQISVKNGKGEGVAKLRLFYTQSRASQVRATHTSLVRSSPLPVFIFIDASALTCSLASEPSRKVCLA